MSAALTPEVAELMSAAEQVVLWYDERVAGSQERERVIAPLVKAIRGVCPTCASIGKGMGPPHFASPRCESGRRRHCSCDTCF